MVSVANSSLEVDSRPKSIGLVWGSAAAWDATYIHQHQIFYVGRKSPTEDMDWSLYTFGKKWDPR